MDSEVLDITVEKEWKPEEWFHCGKRYPESYGLPLEVIKARENLLTILDNYNLLPSPNLTVNQLLQLKIPTIGGNLIIGKPSLAYHMEPPKGDIKWLEDWPIPPTPYIQQLEDALGQQWFNGACSC